MSVWKGCNCWFRVTISSILHASCLTHLSEVSSIQVTVHTSHRVFSEFSECWNTSLTHCGEGLAVDPDLFSGAHPPTRWPWHTLPIHISKILKCRVAEFCPSKSVTTFSAGRRPSFVTPGKTIHLFEPMDLKSGKDHNRIISISFHRHWLSQHCLTPSIASWCRQKLDWLEDEIWNEMDERGWHLGKGWGWVPSWKGVLLLTRWMCDIVMQVWVAFFQETIAVDAVAGSVASGSATARGFSVLLKQCKQ